ncbi:MAG: hypothetical protein KBH78_10480 [Candidatus Hydrogenedentes bacterium]|nr:hypothetical protein [Candidatus Hydrogenedentota bacterium]
MTASDGTVVQVRSPGHVLGGLAGGYMLLDARGYWRPRQDNATPPDWSAPPLDGVCAFVCVRRNDHVYLGRFQADRLTPDPGWENALPAMACRVTREFDGISFNVADQSFFRHAELRVSSRLLPFDYDLSALSVMSLRGLLEPDPDAPYDEWALGFLFTHALFGRNVRDLAWQEIRPRHAGEASSSQVSSGTSAEHPDGLLFFWRDGPESSARARELAVFFQGEEGCPVEPVIRYWPAHPLPFFRRLAAASTSRDAPSWPGNVPTGPDDTPCWIVMGVMPTTPREPVSLTLVWREVQVEPTESADPKDAGSLTFLRPVLAPGTSEYLRRECVRLRAWFTNARPGFVRGALARSYMDMPSRVRLTASGTLFPPSGHAFTYQELIQWYLLFPRWARNTFVAELRARRSEPPYPEALFWIFRAALDSAAGPGPHTDQVFRKIQAWQVWKALLNETKPPDLERATALRALSALAACAGWESAAMELRQRARDVARAWEREMAPRLLLDRDLSFSNREFARSVHFMALGLLFWYDDLVDWRMAVSLLSRVKCQPGIHPEWLARATVLSLVLPDHRLTVWPTELRKVFETCEIGERGSEPYHGFSAWSWPLSVVGGGCWPDLGARRLNLAVPARLDREGTETWQTMTHLGICDLGFSVKADGARLETRLPAPIDLGSLMARIPGSLSRRVPRLIIDDEPVPDKSMTVESAGYGMLLTFSKRLRVGERLVLTL